MDKAKISEQTIIDLFTENVMLSSLLKNDCPVSLRQGVRMVISGWKESIIQDEHIETLLFADALETLLRPNNMTEPIFRLAKFRYNTSISNFTVYCNHKNY